MVRKLTFGHCWHDDMTAVPPVRYCCHGDATIAFVLTDRAAEHGTSLRAAEKTIWRLDSEALLATDQTCVRDG